MCVFRAGTLALARPQCWAALGLRADSHLSMAGTDFLVGQFSGPATPSSAAAFKSALSPVTEMYADILSPHSTPVAYVDQVITTSHPFIDPFSSLNHAMPHKSQGLSDLAAVQTTAGSLYSFSRPLAPRVGGAIDPGEPARLSLARERPVGLLWAHCANAGQGSLAYHGPSRAAAVLMIDLFTGDRPGAYARAGMLAALGTSYHDITIHAPTPFDCGRERESPTPFCVQARCVVWFWAWLPAAGGSLLVYHSRPHNSRLALAF
jgi:hypothetical protein